MNTNSGIQYVIHVMLPIKKFRYIECIKTTSMENVSRGVLDKNKEHYLRCKDKAQKSLGALRHTQLHMSTFKKMKIYNPLCQIYNQTDV